MVHALASSQLRVPAQVPFKHTSSVVQPFASLQAPPSLAGACRQVPALQLSAVHGLPSSVQAVKSGEVSFVQLMLSHPAYVQEFPSSGQPAASAQ